MVAAADVALRWRVLQLAMAIASLAGRLLSGRMREARRMERMRKMQLVRKQHRNESEDLWW